MTTAALTPAAIADSVQTSWAAYLATLARPQAPHAYLYASAWRACDRRSVYELTIPDQLPPHAPELLAKFRRGDDRERDLLADLTRIGRDADPPFQVIGQQERFVLKDRQARPAIVGKVDARLEVAGVRAPLEVKAWSPFLVDKITTFADLFETPWTQAGAYQLLAYLFGAGEAFGFLLLDRSGIPKLLPVELEPNLDRMEAFLTKAETVLDHVARGALPDYLEGDPAECHRCPWFGGICNPPLDAPHAMQVLIDPTLEAAIARRDAIRSIGREYAELDEEIKGKLRGVERAVIGAFEIRGWWGKQSRVELPADLKKQYTKTDPKGRFTLEITKLS